MSRDLPAVEVVRCYFDAAFEPPLPAMCLRWGQPAEQAWELPEGISYLGPAPRHFGVRLRRRGENSYVVRLLWEHTCFLWQSLRRDQLLTCSLAPVLRALGTDLKYLLDQPIEPAPPLSPRAA